MFKKDLYKENRKYRRKWSLLWTAYELQLNLTLISNTRYVPYLL